jgi:hypothetical protein
MFGFGGDVKFSLSIPKNAFVAAEEIPFTIQLENRTRESITKLEVVLSSYSFSETSFIPVSVAPNTILRNTFQFKIPASAPNTISHGVFQSYYTLSLCAHFFLFSSSTVQLHPISIFNIPGLGIKN